QAHLPGLAAASEDVIERFLSRKTRGELATDQLLNAIYLTGLTGVQDRLALADAIMPYLSAPVLGDEPDSVPAGRGHGGRRRADRPAVGGDALLGPAHGRPIRTVSLLVGPTLGVPGDSRR